MPSVFGQLRKRQRHRHPYIAAINGNGDLIRQALRDTIFPGFDRETGSYWNLTELSGFPPNRYLEGADAP